MPKRNLTDKQQIIFNDKAIEVMATMYEEMKKLFSEEPVVYGSNYCPKCNCDNIEQTTIGYIPPARDENKAKCNCCGWEGLVNDLTFKNGIVV